MVALGVRHGRDRGEGLDGRDRRAHRWRRRAAACLLAALAAVLAAILAAGPALAQDTHQLAQDAPLLEQGRRIYQEGLLGDGQPLRASGAGATTLKGPDAACMQCHRRSGMGSREGSLSIPAIAGPVLFNPPVAFGRRRPSANAEPVSGLRQETRQAYAPATLARALRQGLDASGQPLAALMPRYALGEADMQALTGYLQQLSAALPSGLQDGVLHMATIISPDADAQRAATLRRTLQAWVRSAPLGAIAMDLQVWQLSGPASGWQQQLQDYQRQQPVYAVLSGAGRAEWTPVRNFCEQAQLPCLFPMVDLAPSASTDFFTLYFSRGVPLEAQMLARHLQDQQAPPGRVVQMVSDAAGQAAAGLLQQALPGRRHALRAWPASEVASDPGPALDDLQPDDVLVLWLRPAEVAQLLRRMPQGPASSSVYLSAQLTPPQQLALPAAWRAKVRWVSARSDPQRLYGKSVLGLVPWVAQLGLNLEERELLSEIYAACYFFTDALARMRGHWSQDYLMETLENANYARPAGAAFFTLSLAAGQREAAKGGHLLGYADAQEPTLLPLGPRITP